MVPAAAECFDFALTCLLVDLRSGDRAEKVPMAVLEFDQLHGLQECFGDCGFYESIKAYVSCERPVQSDF
jgi:hypothetical protein